MQVLITCINFCLTTVSRGTKFDLTNHYVFDLVPFAPVSRNVSCHTTLPLKTDYLNFVVLALLISVSRCLVLSFVDARERNLFKSRHSQAMPGQTQRIVKVRSLSLGLTVTGCLHIKTKRSDALENLFRLFRLYSVFYFFQKGHKI